MSDEPEARMWDEEEVVRYEDRPRGAFYESAYASTEHLDRAPLLGDESYTEVAVGVGADDAADHCHWKARAEPPDAVPQLITALVLCAIFMVCEVIGGYLAGSLSIMSDAAHMLSDCGGFALALLAFRCAARPPTKHMTYGYRRAEVLGAMVSVLLIWLLTGIFVYMAAARLYSGDYEIHPDTMMVVSGAGLGFNIVLALVLHGCGSSIAHHHSHGGASCDHSHAAPKASLTSRLFNGAGGHGGQNGTVNGDYTLRELNGVEAGVVAPSSDSDRNINLRAALIHVIGDLIQSCGVLLASIIIKFYSGAKWVDPACTFLFSVLVLATSARVVRDAAAMLLQAAPPGFPYVSLVAALRRTRGVRNVHSVHVWQLSTRALVLTAHVATDELADPEQVLKECQRIARDIYKVQSATFQVERYSEYSERCAECISQPGAQP